MPSFRVPLRTLPIALAFALISLSARSNASITPEAQTVLDRYVTAIGGREVVMNERASRIKGRISAFGLEGTVEAWVQHPDRSANVSRIGPFTVRAGNQGAEGWRVDQNGKFTRLDGKDLEDARASAYFENDQWLQPDQGGGTIKLLGTERDSLGRYTVLEVVPPVGRSRRLWFSEKTRLLDRVVAERDQIHLTTHLSDYRADAGRLRAYLTRLEVEGMPMNSAEIRLDSVWVNPVIDPAVFAPADPGVSDTRFLNGRSPASIPFTYRARHVWLKASVNGGAEEDFLLDTGASVTVIDSAYAARRGLRTQGQIGVSGAGAAGGASFSELDSIVVRGSDGQGVVIGHQKVAVLSLNSHLEPFFWIPIAGVLGYDFISRFVTEVDFDRAALGLHEPKGFRYSGAGAAIPLTMAGNIPVAKARIDGQYEGEFRLDVGSGSTVDLHSPFVKQHGLEGKVGKSYEVTGGGFGGTFASTLTRMKKFEIGPYSWSDPMVVLSQATTGGLASQDYAGNVGNHILERFKCTFDYERRQVYLEPGKRYAERDRFSRAGFQLAKFGDVFETLQVIPDSPADKAGLQARDRVLAIDDRPVASYDPEELRRMFEDGAPGNRHTLEIERAGKKRKLKIKLAELL